jgi:uncharacterized protein YdhG (YjbR/CyaY superfamily)
MSRFTINEVLYADDVWESETLDLYCLKSTIMKSTVVENIDAYIAGFPKDVQALLEEVRAAIRKAAPEATEAIKYAMPTFVLNGNLVHFGAYKRHISVYPVPTGDAVFDKLLAPYETSGKGTVQFPLDQPMPVALIEKIVQYQVKRNKEIHKTKAINKPR